MARLLCALKDSPTRIYFFHLDIVRKVPKHIKTEQNTDQLRSGAGTSHMLFRLCLSLWFASSSAQLCASSREFAVGNCTACPTFDQTRHGGIRMAVCKE